MSRLRAALGLVTPEQRKLSGILEAPSHRPAASICDECREVVIEHGRGWRHLDGTLTCGGRSIGALAEDLDLALGAAHTEGYEEGYQEGYEVGVRKTRIDLMD